MDGSALSLTLAALALLLALVGLALAVVGLRRTSPGRRRRAAAAMPTDLQGLRGEVAALRDASDEALRHLAVVRYDAFGDMGGQLSWSLALLDDGGDGVVLTSIHGRSEARSYAKNVAGWVSDQALSPEEDQALTLARAG